MMNQRTTVLNPDFAHWVEELYKAARDLVEGVRAYTPNTLRAEVGLVETALDNVAEYLGP